MKLYRLYNESPVRDTIVTNDRWGRGTLCEHGDFLTCSDRFNPGNFCQLLSCQIRSIFNGMQLRLLLLQVSCRRKNMRMHLQLIKRAGDIEQMHA